LTGRLPIALVALAMLGSSLARADHHGMAMDDASDASLGLGLAVVTARYDTPYFVGDYEGATPTVHGTLGRWSGMAMLGAYRLEENGRTLYGLGDLMMAATATLVETPAWRAGFTGAAMVPIGDQPTGFGMGHAMLMPSAWLGWRTGPLALRGSVGYGRALADLAGHDHGPWPLVDPMNMQEIAWGVSAALPVWRRLELAVGGTGAVPFGVAMGVDRVAGSARAAWSDPGVVTAVELQVGVLGDPYVVRGLVEVMVRL